MFNPLERPLPDTATDQLEASKVTLPMPDIRRALLNGNETTSGGVLIGSCETMSHHGTRVAVQGDFATCPACKNGGPVFNDCEPNFNLMGKSILVEGARVHCKCPEKPYVIPSQNDFTIEVNRGSGVRVPADTSSTMTPEASNKVVAAMQEKTFTEDQTLICPNMSNAEFRALMLRLRDKAVKDVDNRLREISTWGKTDQAKMALYFGPPDSNLRSRLKDGLTRIRALLVSLSESNFERYSEESLARTGCAPKAPKDNLGAASVCGPDGLHRIFIWPAFCRLPDELKDSKGNPVDGDSKLLTLIHEVSHFQDAMGTRDVWYSTRNSRWKAADANRFCIENAENIAAYTVGIWDDRV